MTLFTLTLFQTFTKKYFRPSSSKYFSHIFPRISDSSWERKRAGSLSGTFWKIWRGHTSLRKRSKEASGGTWRGRLWGQEDLLQRGWGGPGRGHCSRGPQRREQHPSPHHLGRGLNWPLNGLYMVRESWTCDPWLLSNDIQWETFKWWFRWLLSISLICDDDDKKKEIQPLGYFYSFCITRYRSEANLIIY